MLRGLTPQQAVDLPRFSIAPSSEDTGSSNISRSSTANSDSPVYFEDTFDPKVVEGLRGEYSTYDFSRGLF